MDNIQKYVKKVFTPEYYAMRSKILNYLKKAILRKFREISDIIQSEKILTMSRSYKLLQEILGADMIYNKIEEMIFQQGGFSFHQVAELYNSSVNFLMQEIEPITCNLRAAVSQICADPTQRTYNVKVNMIQVLRYRRKEYESQGYRISSHYAEKHRSEEPVDSVDLAEERVKKNYIS